MKINPRIIAGSLKGLRLKVPEESRPVTDRVKQVIFDILGSFVKDTIVLDLFTGSGNLGIEAISRGAKALTLVDNSQDAINITKENLRKAGIDSQSEVFKKDFRSFAEECTKKYNLIFLDPPFRLTSSVHLKDIAKLLKKNGIIVFKFPTNEISKVDLPDSLSIVEEKEIGINFVYFLQKS